MENKCLRRRNLEHPSKCKVVREQKCGFKVRFSYRGPELEVGCERKRAIICG